MVANFGVNGREPRGTAWTCCQQCPNPQRCAELSRCGVHNPVDDINMYHGLMKPPTPPINGADAMKEAGKGHLLGKGHTIAAREIKANLTREDVLKEAIDVTKARGLKYGQPEDNFARIARHWRAYMKNRWGLDVPLGSRDVALLMDLMKTSRLENEITHHDSWVDKAGYAACGAVIKEPVREPGEEG